VSVVREPRVVLLDDHLLVEVLQNRRVPGLRSTDRLATTGLWLHRLARAISTSSVAGTLSVRLDVDIRIARDLTAALIELPAHIELVSLRQLAAPMAALLSEGVRLNLMSLEALAAAELLGAQVWLSSLDDNHALRAAAEQRAVRIRMVNR
jgi:hypothetical protein